MDCQWTLLFMSALSSIWFWHNKQIHDGSFIPPFRPVDSIKVRVCEVLQANVLRQIL